jgi:LDH2 family malate/lactate/ureidoglycolate dehydrogenase
VLADVGADAEAAALVADCLVDADRRGVHTHGLVRLPSYVAQARAGEVVPGARPVVVREEGPTALLDARRGFGAVSGVAATDTAVERARRYGVGVVAVREANHFGAASYYARRAAAAGFVGLAATNTPAVMAPTGGREPTLGNNPFALAAPALPGRPPLVLDMAQTAVARGRIKLAELNGEAIPEGWALAPDGASTTDPTAALAGALLPFGGYKGYGLALAVEVLAGVLSGAPPSREIVNTGLTASPGAAGGGGGRSAVGNLFLALDPERFVGRVAFAAGLAALVEAVKDTPLAAGADEVLVPGELEARSEAEANARGVALQPSGVAELEALARAGRIAFPPPRDQ